jgi:hypothetical protein
VNYSNTANITITVNGILTLQDATLYLDTPDKLIVNSGGQLVSSGVLGGTIYSGGFPFAPVLSWAIGNFGSGTTLNGPLDITGGALPVELVSFLGEAKKWGVLLRWQTASEINNSYFTIYRSTNGIDFEAVGKVNGSGTTNSAHSYSYTDYKPSIGRNYYCLKQTDFDGNSKKYEIIAIELNSIEPLISISPNPLSQNQLLSAIINGLPENKPAEIEILNVGGTVMNHFVLSANSEGTLLASFNLANLSPGFYILKSQVAQLKFIVE